MQATSQMAVSISLDSVLWICPLHSQTRLRFECLFVELGVILAERVGQITIVTRPPATICFLRMVWPVGGSV
ncbi:MAG: hypothetical protein KDK39_01430 [Leptospiraceae bacterium]|nr:hypothetical protein [Leptospiraceae bacterium]